MAAGFENPSIFVDRLCEGGFPAKTARGRFRMTEGLDGYPSPDRRLRSECLTLRYKFEPASVKFVVIAAWPPKPRLYFYDPTGSIEERLFKLPGRPAALIRNNAMKLVQRRRQIAQRSSPAATNSIPLCAAGPPHQLWRRWPHQLLPQ